MKLRNLLLSAAALSLMTACTKEDLQVTFDLNAANVVFVVKATPQSGAMAIDAQNLSYNLDSVCKANNVNKDQIKSVKIKEVFLDIVDNNNTTFDLVDWAEAYVGAAGQADLLLAAKNPVPKDGTRSISLDVKSVELADYIKSNQMSFFAKGQTNAPVKSDVEMRARVTFSITGQIVK